MPTQKSDATAPAAFSMPMAGAAFAMAASRAWLKSFSDYNKELSRFLAHRLEQDADLQTKLASCQKPAEMVEIYSEFTQNAFKEYADETQRLQAVAAEAMSSGMKTAGKSSGTTAP